MINGKAVTQGQVIELEDRYADLLVEAGSALPFAKNEAVKEEETEEEKPSTKKMPRPFNKSSKVTEDK